MSDDEKELFKTMQQPGAITIKKTEKQDIGYIYEVDEKTLTQIKNKK